MTEKARLMPALGAGFGLIVRDPAAVILWGVIYIILSVGPLLLFIPFMGAGVLDYYRDLMTAGTTGAPPPPAMLGTLWPLFQLLQMVIGLLAVSLLYSAIYRAVLRPAERGFAYLRLSIEELYLAVVMVVLYILMLVAMVVGVIALLIPIGILAAIVGSNDETAAVVGLVAFLVVIAAMIGGLIPAVRLGMALPMTIAERQIRIFEAWTFTRGYTWRLLGLALMQVLVILAVYIVVGGLLVGVVIGGLGGFSSLSNLSSMNMEALTPLLVVGGVLWLLVVFVITPVLVAPWARAYELIATARGEDKNTVFD